MYLFNVAKSPNAITADDIKKLNLKKEDSALLLSLLNLIEGAYNHLAMSFHVIKENECTRNYTEIACKVYTKKDSLLNGSYLLTTFSLGKGVYCNLSAITNRIQNAIKMFTTTADRFRTAIK